MTSTLETTDHAPRMVFNSIVICGNHPRAKRFYGLVVNDIPPKCPECGCDRTSLENVQ